MKEIIKPTLRWKKSKTSVYNIGYHLIWCPKYRRNVLIGEIESRFKELIIEKAESIDVEIIEFEVMPDHIHIFCKSNPTNSIHFIVNQFKGYTSKVLREEFPSLKKRLPSLWTRSYFCETVGCISENTIKKYIENQKRSR